ncbi:MAG: hypothetical protein H0W99_06440 [Acidobacteria bacterium]|nr:hypothetical protein [Acidobacteriota bacterium]
MAIASFERPLKALRVEDIPFVSGKRVGIALFLWVIRKSGGALVRDL